MPQKRFLRFKARSESLNRAPPDRIDGRVAGPQPRDQVARNGNVRLEEPLAFLRSLRGQVCVCTPQDEGPVLPPPTRPAAPAQGGPGVCPRRAQPGHSRDPPSPRTRTYLTLLPVQVELVLANGHGPDGLDQGRARVPCVHRDATVSERPPRHGGPGKARVRGAAMLMTKASSEGEGSGFLRPPRAPTPCRRADGRAWARALGKMVAKAVYFFC